MHSSLHHTLNPMFYVTLIHSTHAPDAYCYIYRLPQLVAIPEATIISTIATEATAADSIKKKSERQET